MKKFLKAGVRNCKNYGIYIEGIFAIFIERENTPEGLIASTAVCRTFRHKPLIFQIRKI